MKTIKLIMLIGLLLIISAFSVVAQDDACPTIVSEVLAQVEDICSATARNQACYGNVAISVVERDPVQFEAVGDIADVSAIESLRLSPMDESSEAWGVAMMRLQANLPDTLPGQNVTFLLFGDVELTNAVSANNTSATPMQAFYLRTGVGDASCAEAPDSGLLVQTPEGVGEVAFSVNGVDVSLGSTALFQAQGGGRMSVTSLEGATYTSYDGEDYPIVEGTFLDIPLGEDLLPDGLPELLEAYDLEILENLPIELLDREFEIELPLTEDQLNELEDRIEQGIALCEDDSFLPTCDHLPFRFGGDACWLEDDGSFNCEIERDFLWGEEGFGDFDYEDFWQDFEFDFDTLEIDNILDEYGFEDLDEFTELFGGPLVGDLEDIDPERLRNLLDTLGLEALDDLDIDLEDTDVGDVDFSNEDNGDDEEPDADNEDVDDSEDVEDDSDSDE